MTEQQLKDIKVSIIDDSLYSKEYKKELLDRLTDLYLYNKTDSDYISALEQEIKMLKFNYE